MSTKLVSVEANTNNTLDVVLEQNGVQVQCRNLDNWEFDPEFDDHEMLDHIFEEWMDLATDGEEDFIVL